MPESLKSLLCSEHFQYFYHLQILKVEAFCLFVLVNTFFLFELFTVPHPHDVRFGEKKSAFFFLLLPRTTASLNVRKQVQLFFLLSFFLIGYTFAYMTDSLIRDIFSLLCAGCTPSSAPVLAAERERNKVVLGYVTHHKDLCHFAALSSDTYNHSRYDSKNNGILTLRFGLFPLHRFTVVHARRVCVVYNRLQVLTIFRKL